ncbi:hypothetical protein BASA62_003681 [Batrachochytrium salamandrivorans]|nr:hypothetical protein BASA62_003681 [Batrachochytrium salamandrivorans]
MISKTSTGRIPNKDVVQGRLSSTASKPNSATSMLKSATPKTNTIESTATCFKPIQKISTLNAIKVVSPLGNGKHKTPYGNPTSVRVCRATRTEGAYGGSQMHETRWPMCYRRLLHHYDAGLGSKEKESFLASLEILRMIALLVGTLLTPHLSSLLPQVASRILAADQDIRESVQDCLCDCQIACGPAALKIIRSRVPTFSSMLV